MGLVIFFMMFCLAAMALHWKGVIFAKNYSLRVYLVTLSVVFLSTMFIPIIHLGDGLGLWGAFFLAVLTVTWQGNEYDQAAYIIFGLVAVQNIVAVTMSILAAYLYGKKKVT